MLLHTAKAFVQIKRSAIDLRNVTITRWTFQGTRIQHEVFVVVCVSLISQRFQNVHRVHCLHFKSLYRYFFRLLVSLSLVSLSREGVISKDFLK